jgi:hypothetical protein
VQTNRIVSKDTSIIIHDTEKGICMLIDVAILRDKNAIKKEAEKILKHTTLQQKISIIIWATGTISRSFSSIAGKHRIKELQKIAILGTANIFEKY